MGANEQDKSSRAQCWRLGSTPPQFSAAIALAESQRSARPQACREVPVPAAKMRGAAALEALSGLF